MTKTPILRRPLEVAFLNLNGWGLGFAYAGRWIRFGLYLVLNGLILATAFVTKAHRLPWLWGGVFLSWPLWQAFDGWLATVLRNRRYPEAVIPWRWPALVAAVAALGIALIGATSFGLLGQWEYQRGMTAFERTDFTTACRRFENFTTYYTITLNPNLKKAETKLEECALLAQAARLSEHGNYEAAIGAYQEYQERFGTTEIDSYIQEQIAANYRLRALELLATDAYERAIEKYRVIQERYAGTESGARLEQDLAEAYARWANFLLEQGEYEAAIEKYRRFASQYPAATWSRQVPLEIAKVYIAWGNALATDGDFLGALEKFQQAQVGVEDDQLVQEARRQYESALYQLSRDPGSQGWIVMNATLIRVCKGQPAASAAIGYQVNEAPRARLCHGKDTPTYALPFDLQAEYPAHFLYVIKITVGSTKGKDCGWYVSDRTGSRLRLYLDRPWWKVEVISTLTGLVAHSKRFEGRTSYSYCPSTYTYQSSQVSGNEIHDEGLPPDEEAIGNWLRQVMK